MKYSEELVPSTVLKPAHKFSSEFLHNFLLTPSFASSIPVSYNFSSQNNTNSKWVIDDLQFIGSVFLLYPDLQQFWFFFVFYLHMFDYISMLIYISFNVCKALSCPTFYFILQQPLLFLILENEANGR